MNSPHWSHRNYSCTVSFNESGTEIDIAGIVQTNALSKERPSVFLETSNLNINDSTPTFSMKFRQDSSVAIIVRFGVNYTEWLDAIKGNTTLEQLRYGGSTENLVWVMREYSEIESAGSLEGVWGSGNWQSLSVNWKAYLNDALGYNFSSLDGLEIILGFKSDGESFESQINDIAFSADPQIVPFKGEYSGTEFVFHPSAINAETSHGFFPERAHVQFEMPTNSSGNYMALMVWKTQDGNLVVVRNGFEMQATSSQSLWIDFWNTLSDIKMSTEPFSTLNQVMSPDDYALVFFSTRSGKNDTAVFFPQNIDLFFSKPGLGVSFTQFDVGSVLNETTFYIVLVGIVPLIVLTLLYKFRKKAYSNAGLWFSLVLASGLAIRFVLVPISSHPYDVMQFTDIGALFYGQRSFFSFWVDFPLYYYPLVGISLPYSLARSMGFEDFSFFAGTSYVWQMITIKIIPIFADVVAYFCLFKMVGKGRSGLAKMIPEIFFLSPIVILTSATWAHLNSLFIALLIVGIYFLRKGSWLKTVLFFSLASMTIPVGFAGLLALLLVTLFLKAYRLTAKMLFVSSVTFLVLFLPMAFGSGTSVFSLFQRLTAGQVVSAPVYGSNPISIGGATVYPFLTSGYKFTRILESFNIGLPSFLLSGFLVATILAITIWFVYQVRSKSNTLQGDLHESLSEIIVRYMAVVFCLFLLFYSTVNFIWNSWPLFFLILLMFFVDRKAVAVFVIIYSYVLLAGYEFSEHLSLLATGYNIQYITQLGLHVDYWSMNLLFSLLFSLLAVIVIRIALLPSRSRNKFLREQLLRLFSRGEKQK